MCLSILHTKEEVYRITDELVRISSINMDLKRKTKFFDTVEWQFSNSIRLDYHTGEI